MQSKKQRLSLVVEQVLPQLPPLIQPVVRTFSKGYLDKMTEESVVGLTDFLRKLADYIDNGTKIQ